MGPETQARIFEPFFTTKPEGHGTGIGLATVIRLVKKHGGLLRVESAPGQGSTFEVLLPRASEADRAAHDPAAPQWIAGNQELILVVDAEKAIRELVGEGLAAHGYRVMTAINGTEAVDLIARHRPELRLCFIHASLPLAEGVGIIAALRTSTPVLPIIVTGGDDNESLAEFRAAGAMPLPKPFALSEVLVAVQDALNPSSKTSSVITES